MGRLVLTIFCSTLFLLVGCGSSPAPDGTNDGGLNPTIPATSNPSTPRTFATLTPDGSFEVLLNNGGFNPASNCFQLVQESFGSVAEFNPSVCATPSAAVDYASSIRLLVTSDGYLMGNDKQLGRVSQSPEGAVVTDLCSGTFKTACTLVVQGGVFTKIVVP